METEIGFPLVLAALKGEVQQPQRNLSSHFFSRYEAVVGRDREEAAGRSVFR